MVKVILENIFVTKYKINLEIIKKRLTSLINGEVDVRYEM